MKGRAPGKKNSLCGVYILLVVLVFLINLPIINMFGVSLKGPKEILINNSIIPIHPTMQNYAGVFQKTKIGTYLYNSFYIAIIVTLLTMFVASLAGYAISRFSSRFKILKGYNIVLLLMQMFPTILILIPLFLTFKILGIADTRASIILVYLTFSLPFCTWMMTGFFYGIPIDLDEAGMIDGCTSFQTFCRIILPVSGPGVASVGIFAFIYCWNEYMLASIFLKSDSMKTLPLGIQTFIQQYNTDWGLLMAASVITMIPAMLFLLLMQKYLVAGLTAGAVKG